MSIRLHDIPEERIIELVERLDVRGPRYTSYPTVPVWQSASFAEPYARALEKLAATEQPISVYVHLPFCRSRCLYCGCNSCITVTESRIRKYMEALDVEIRRVTENFGGGVKHGQLHLGGGTPTYTPPELLASSLDLLIERIPGIDGAERSVEVDPRVTTDEHLKLLAERGFWRISVGLQDLNPEVQRAIHREYTLDELKDFVDRCRSFGFDSVNIDLIYGLPLQNRESWRATLREIERLRPDRLACFGYAHLPQKIKHQRAIHEEDLPAPRERLGMLLDANRYFTEQGYTAIGMDHFALAEDELAEAQRNAKLWRNFMGYTTSRGMELLGFGCSAISEFNDLFVQSLSDPEEYGAEILAARPVVNRGHILSGEDKVRKQIINHLMCNLRIDLQSVHAAAESDLLIELQESLATLKHYEADGLIERANGGYRVTDLGQLFVRNLAMPFDGYLKAQTGATFSRTV